MKTKHYLIFLWVVMIGLVFGLAACGGQGPKYSPEMIAKGEEDFIGTCSACHGPDAKGLPNLGKDLTISEFVAEKTDEELITMIKTGRPSGDPLNTTGIDMPPKGGNPALNDEDVQAIVAYIRSIHN